MNIGARTHDFGKTTIDNFSFMAKQISQKGFKCVQLALDRTFEGFKQQKDYLNPGLANHIRLTLEKNNIYCAILGCYINPIHPELKERKNQIDFFKDHIKFAHDFGARVIVTESGSINSDSSYNPATYTESVFNDFIKSISELIEEAEKFGVFVAFEAVANKNIIDSPEKMKKVLDTIRSNNIQVVFDPVNLIDINELDKQDDMIKKSFDLFGDKMIAFHLKDFVIENGIKKRIPSGKGIFNFELFIKLIKQTKFYPSLILEDCSMYTFDDAVGFIKSVYDRC